MEFLLSVVDGGALLIQSKTKRTEWRRTLTKTKRKPQIYILILGISSIQRALQSTLFSADKMKIVVNMDGHVLFFNQSDFVKLSFCSSTCPPHSLLLQFEKNPPDVSHFDLKLRYWKPGMCKRKIDVILLIKRRHFCCI